MNESTAMATIDVPETKIAVRMDWTPEAFKAEVEREKQMRGILREYVQSEMKLGHHYDDHIGSQKLVKPMLLQEGARNICSLFKVIFGPPQITETYLDDGHYRVRAHVEIFNMEGRQIATGDGVCSTRESKYAYRKGERLCPDCGAAAIIKDKFREGGGWLCYGKKDGCGAKFDLNDAAIQSQVLGRVENPDKADLENTILKMAVKRAKVGAVCDLPLVSELFSPEDDAGSDDRPDPEPPRSAGRSTKPPQSSPQQTAPTVPQSVARAVDLVEKLTKQHGVELEDLSVQFLPEGVATFSGLSEEQSVTVVPGLVQLLNSKVAAKK